MTDRTVGVSPARAYAVLATSALSCALTLFGFLLARRPRHRPRPAQAPTQTHAWASNRNDSKQPALALARPRSCCSFRMGCCRSRSRWRGIGVVDLAVDRERELAVLRVERLIARERVHDGEPLVRDRGVRAILVGHDVHARAVGAAMADEPLQRQSLQAERVTLAERRIAVAAARSCCSEYWRSFLPFFADGRLGSHSSASYGAGEGAAGGGGLMSPGRAGCGGVAGTNLGAEAAGGKALGETLRRLPSALRAPIWVSHDMGEGEANELPGSGSAAAAKERDGDGGVPMAAGERSWPELASPRRPSWMSHDAGLAGRPCRPAAHGSAG